MKICVLGIGFVSIIIVVNNSCEDVVKVCVNGIVGIMLVFVCIVVLVICGWIFVGVM